MMQRNLRFHLQRDFSYNGFAMHITDENGSQTSILTETTFEPLAQNSGRMIPPSLVLNYGEAQNLMDALFAQGIRPTDAKGTPGQIEAMKEHLSDMRKLVFEQPIVEIVTHNRRASDKKPRTNRGAGIVV